MRAQRGSSATDGGASFRIVADVALVISFYLLTFIVLLILVPCTPIFALKFD